MSVEWVIGVALVGFILGIIAYRRRVTAQQHRVLTPPQPGATESENALPPHEGNVYPLPTFRSKRLPSGAGNARDDHHGGDGMFGPTVNLGKRRVVQFQDPKLQTLFSKQESRSPRTEIPSDKDDKRP